MNSLILPFAIAFIFSIGLTKVSAASSQNLVTIEQLAKMSKNSQVVNSVIDLSTIPLESQKALKERAEELASIWGDTILEGDYYAKEETNLDQVQVLRTKDGMTVGYRITYSAPAWSLSHCDFDYEHLDTLSKCEAGQIVESGLVTADLKQATQETYAEFRN